MTKFFSGMLTGILLYTLLGSSNAHVYEAQKMNDNLRDTNRHLSEISRSLQNIKQPFGSSALKVETR